MSHATRRDRWRRRRRLQARPLIHLVPNAFTVASICFGLSAIRYGLDGHYQTAVVMIILAGVFDGLDGRSARLLKITSKLGAELDSLADFLSFGVAPAFLVYLWSLHEAKGLGWAIALFYVICAALRLARFNSELEDKNRPPWMTRFFTGMPAPAAAGVVIVPMMLTFALDQDWPSAWLLNAFVVVTTALMMVSTVKTFSIKMVTTRIRPEYLLPTLVGIGVIITALVNVPWWTLLIVAFIYLVSLPIGVITASRLAAEAEATSGGSESVTEGDQSDAGPKTD
ncbi:MAG: CDP-diacylglycerol--serine O-phosphatidyltransferase [Alphaproteobacteria bacterium]|nr:CDP-diacylglycerol--serine O-phosphatidyltransferase [Alphaproteobacteria bacterium]